MATKWTWYPLGAVWRVLRRNGKRIAVSVVGGILVVAGLAMFVLPGPGVVLLIAGLAVLASEYVWAQRALNFTKERAGRAKNVLRKRAKRG